MQTDLGKKLLSLINTTHPDYNKERVDSELEFMEEHNVCGDILSLYNKIHNGSSQIGNKNVLNSLVGYLLGITTKKPDVDFKLEKRRTYARANFPDIDVDINHYRRHEVVDYLFNKYGRENVANIGTIQRLKMKNAIHKAVMVLDPDRSVVFDEHGNKVKEERSENHSLRMRMVNTLPDFMKRADGSLIKTIKEAYNEYSEFRAIMDQYPEVYEVAQKLEDGISAYSSHAAGFVVSPFPLSNIAPLHVTGKTVKDGSSSQNKTLATQFVASDVESLGLIKFDVLGLLTKTVITMTTDLISDRYGKEINVDALPLDDPKTISLYKSGKTDGIFQCEKSGMKRTLIEIGIDSFDDLAVAIAMYRPGPLAFISDYAKRKRNPESVQYIHPIVEKYTRDTYNIIVFQEQAMQIFVDLAGLTNSEGYIFIKGAAKKKPELFNSMKDRFIRGATKRSNKKIAEEIWNQLQPFQGYAFNRSHAVSYAYESWTTAYLKAHYPLEFMSARLTVASLDREFEDVDKFESDCQQNLGIRILPSHLNKSKMHYTIDDEKTLRRPMGIKGIGALAAEEIVKNQPYKGPDFIGSFAKKVGSIINIAVVEAMCDVKLFGDINKAKAKRAFETVKSDRKKSKGCQTNDLFG